MKSNKSIMVALLFCVVCMGVFLMKDRIESDLDGSARLSRQADRSNLVNPSKLPEVKAGEIEVVEGRSCDVESSRSHMLTSVTAPLVEAMKAGRPLLLKVAGVERQLLLAPKQIFKKGAKIRLGNGELYLDPAKEVHVFSGGVSLNGKVDVSAEAMGVVQDAGKAAPVVPKSGVNAEELLARFDASRANMTIIGGQMVMSMGNKNRDRVLLRINPDTGGMEMRYEPTKWHEKMFGECASGSFSHNSSQKYTPEMDLLEEKKVDALVEAAGSGSGSGVSDDGKTWVPLSDASVKPAFYEEEGEHAIGVHAGDPTVGSAPLFVGTPVPLGERYSKSLRRLSIIAQTEPGLLQDGANPTDQDISSMLCRIFLSMEEVNEIYERNMAVNMLVAEWTVRTSTDPLWNTGLSGLRGDEIAYTWRGGQNNIVARGRFYKWGGGGGAAGRNFSISAWPVGAAHEIGHILGLAHTNTGDMMGETGGPAHFWGLVLPDYVYCSADTLYRNFQRYWLLRQVGLEDRGLVDGEGQGATATPEGASNTLRNPKEMAYAENDNVVTAKNVAIEFDPLANDLRSVPYSQHYNEEILIEEVGRLLPADAGQVEIINSGKKLRFTPANHFEGKVYFNYSLRGSIGNNGKGWLSRATVGITVGNPTSDPTSITLAPSQMRNIFFGATVTQETYPTKSEIRAQQYANSKVLAIRAHPDASGSESFNLNVGGVSTVINVTYTTPARAAVDDFYSADGGKKIRFNPLINDKVVGHQLNEYSIATTIAEVLDPVTGRQNDFRRAYVLVSGTLADPKMGSLEMETSYHVFPNGSWGDAPTNYLIFKPAAGASGYAVINYVAKDSDDTLVNGVAKVLVGLAEVVRPAREFTRLRMDMGLVLETQKIPASGAGFTGVSSLQWSVLSKPTNSTVTFENATSTSAVAYFDTAGRYRLRLSADDNGNIKIIDRWVIVEDVSVTPSADIENAPWVNATKSQLVGWNQASWNTSTLGLQAMDDRYANLIDLAWFGTAGVSNGIYEMDLGADKDVKWVDVYFPTDQFTKKYLGTNYNDHPPSPNYDLVIELQNEARTTVKRYVPQALSNYHHRHRVMVPSGSGIRYIRVRGTGTTQSFTVDRVRAVGLDNDLQDLTREGDATQSTRRKGLGSDGGAELGVNNIVGGGNGARTDDTTADNWWEFTLDSEKELRAIVLDLGLPNNGGTITAYNAAGAQTWQMTLNGDTEHTFANIPANTLAKRIRVTAPSGIARELYIEELYAYGVNNQAHTTQWSLASGSLAASFGDTSQVDTTVTLNGGSGLYTLRLTSDDGWNKTVKDFAVNYVASSTGPVGNGLADLELGTAGGNSANIDLFAAFDDAETADGSMSYQVVSVSNGSLFNTSPVGSIADPSNFKLNIKKGISGTSSVVVRATDGDGNSRDLSFNVTTANRAPTLPDVIDIRISELTTIGTEIVDLTAYVTDLDGDTLTFTYPDNLIANRYAWLNGASDGKVTVDENLDTINTNEHGALINVAVSDGVHPPQFFVLNVLIDDANRTPQIDDQNFFVRENAIPGYAVYKIRLSELNDPGETYTWSILSGNEQGHWSINTSSGALTPLVRMNASTTPSYQLVVQVLDNGVPAKTGTATVTIAVGSGFGFVLEDFFSGIGGASVADMTTHANYPNNPTTKKWVSLNGLHMSDRGLGGFGRRVRGALTVPSSGNYTFHLASDDASEFWLSTDATAPNLVKVVELTGYRGELDFNGPVSSPIALVAGQRYFFEILHKENGGADHLAVGWSGPGGINQELIPNSQFQFAVDADADGLDDWWEFTYIGNMASRASDDPDNDGQTNLQELQAGTHPGASPLMGQWLTQVNLGVLPEVLDVKALKGNKTRSVDLSRITGSATFEFLVNASDTGANMVDLLESGADILRFEQYNNRGVLGISRYGSGDFVFSSVAGQSVASPYGALHQLVYVMDSTTSTTFLYVDGVHVGSITGKDFVLNSATSVLGATNLGNDGNPGIIGFAAYNNALSPAEVLAHYQAFQTIQPISNQVVVTATDIPKTISSSGANTITSTLTVANLVGSLTDVNITLDITHTYTGDLDIYLIHPDGTRVELTTDNGGGGDHFSGTTFDQSSSQLITAGSAPFSGVFRPEGDLNTLNTKTANGVWTLEVRDDANFDGGTLNSWSITLAGVRVTNDSDGDSLNDDWELTHYGNLITVTATDDTDGDGLNSFEEMIFGSNPNVNEPRQNSIKSRIVDDGGTQKFEFKFQRPQSYANLNAVYTLESSSNMQDGSWAPIQSIPVITPSGNNEWVTYLLPMPSGGEIRVFYRVNVTLAP